MRVRWVRVRVRGDIEVGEGEGEGGRRGGRGCGGGTYVHACIAVHAHMMTLFWYMEQEAVARYMGQ